MPWTDPTGYTANGWVDPTYAYNNNTGNHALYDIPAQSWSGGGLELTISSILCDSVRVYADGQTADIDQIRVEVYYSGSYHNIYEGAFTQDQYTTYPIGSTETVTAMRLWLYNSKTSARDGYLCDADFNEIIEAGTKEITDEIVGVGEYLYQDIKLWQYLLDDIEVLEYLEHTNLAILCELVDIVEVSDYTEKYLTTLNIELIDTVETLETPVDFKPFPWEASLVSDVGTYDYTDGEQILRLREVSVYTDASASDSPSGEQILKLHELLLYEIIATRAGIRFFDEVEITEWTDGEAKDTSKNKELIDNVAITDALTQYLTSLNIELYDLIGVSEYLEQSVGWAVELIDIVEVYDQLSHDYLAVEAWLQDYVEVSDYTQRHTIIFSPLLYDSVGVEDFLDYTRLAGLISVYDYVSAEDSIDFMLYLSSLLQDYVEVDEVLDTYYFLEASVVSYAEVFEEVYRQLGNLEKFLYDIVIETEWWDTIMTGEALDVGLIENLWAYIEID